MPTDLFDNTKFANKEDDLFDDSPTTTATDTRSGDSEDDWMKTGEVEDTGYGTSALVKKIREWTNSNKPVLADIFLINVETIVRNNTTLDREDVDIIDKTYAD